MGIALVISGRCCNYQDRIYIGRGDLFLDKLSLDTDLFGIVTQSALPSQDVTRDLAAKCQSHKNVLALFDGHFSYCVVAMKQ